MSSEQLCAGDPRRFGFRECARCRTLVLHLTDFVLEGDAQLDEMGKPVQVCAVRTYCDNALVKP